MKKYLSIILAILLVMSALTGCAGKNNPTKQDNALNTTATDPETAPVSESSNSPSVSNTSAAYEKLIAYKTDTYSQQSVADFNNLLLNGNDARNGENPHEYRLFCPSILLLILD